jgi:hypothetical protein
MAARPVDARDRTPAIQASMVELLKGTGLSEATVALMAEAIAENARFNLWAAIYKKDYAAEDETLRLLEQAEELETRCRAAVRDFRADRDEARLRRVLADVIRELINIRMT